MSKAIAILCGGGPAPGINTVVASVAKVFLKDGYRVIGLHEGYKSLFSKDPRMVDIDFAFADEIAKKGGAALQMSRYKPKDETAEAQAPNEVGSIGSSQSEKLPSSVGTGFFVTSTPAKILAVSEIPGNLSCKISFGR